MIACCWLYYYVCSHFLQCKALRILLLTIYWQGRRLRIFISTGRRLRESLSKWKGAFETHCYLFPLRFFLLRPIAFSHFNPGLKGLFCILSASRRRVDHKTKQDPGSRDGTSLPRYSHPPRYLNSQYPTRWTLYPAITLHARDHQNVKPRLCVVHPIGSLEKLSWMYSIKRWENNVKSGQEDTMWLLELKFFRQIYLKPI